MRGSCSKRQAYMVANIRKWEREEKQRNGRNLVMTKKWSWTPTYVIHNSNRVHFPDSAEKRPSRLHRRLMRFNLDLVSSYLQPDINKFPSAS